MHFRMLSFAVAGLMVAGFALTPAKADEWNKRTTVTFSAPVEIPGRVLPAGTYVMMLADSPSDRDIVQFFNKDQTHLIQTVLAIPDYRLNLTSHTVITFEERAAGAPQAIKTWFYPGSYYGEEFLYKHFQPVSAAQDVAPPAPATTAAPQPVAQSTPAPQPAPQPEEMAKAEPAPTPAPAAAPAPAPQAPAKPAKTLPKTASDLPLIGLFSVLSIAAGVTLRRKQLN